MVSLVASAASMEKTGLRARTARQLQDKIIADGLQPGDRLAPERELAEVFEVSRSTMRDAINTLEQAGMVRRVVGSGTYLTQIPEETVGATLERYFNFNNYPHLSVLEIRELLEPGIAADVALKATPADVEHLGTLVEEIERTYVRGDFDANIHADVAFHHALIRCYGNELLAAMTEGLYRLMRDRLLSMPDRPKPIRNLTMSHRPIFEAIVRRDAAAAREAMQHHMEVARANYFRKPASKPTSSPSNARRRKR